MSEPTGDAAEPLARGTIHDLGYKRYVGSRRSAATRWRVIMRNQITIAWKKWWRYKLPLFLAIVTTFVAGAIMYFMAQRNMRMLVGDGFQLKIMDGVLPETIDWYCRFPAFMLSLTLGSMIIANDTQTGAFTFYYVRPVRARDYVIGKLAGYGVLVGTLVLVPPLLLAGFRLGMSENLDQLVDQLIILPKVLAIGTLATLAYTAVPLALSSLVHKRAYAIALWAAYYTLFGYIAIGVSRTSGSFLAALDIREAILAITQDLFDVRTRGRPSFDLTATSATLMLLAQVAAAIGLIWYQVSRDEKAGVGSS